MPTGFARLSTVSTVSMGLSLATVFVSLFVSGCEKDSGQLSTGLQSLRVTMVSPTADPSTGFIGSPNSRVSPTEVVFDVEALGPDGKTWAQDLDADVYLSFGGNKVGQVSACGTGQDTMPLASVHLTAGVAKAQTVKLVAAYGETTIWIEERATHALGASPRIYFPSPTIPVVQTPLDLKASTATYCTPWNGRHVIIDTATNGGKLVVTSVFTSAYVVADTGSPYDPTVPLSGFNHLYVFSFGKPAPEIKPGLVLTNLSGNLSKFVGFSELNFPLQEWLKTDDAKPIYDRASVPAAYPLTADDQPVTQAKVNNSLRLLPLDSATVKISGSVCCIQTGGDPAKDPSNVCCNGAAAPCAPDTQWQKFNQFVVNVDGGCDSFNNFSIALPTKMLGSFDPLANAGKNTGFQFVGMLKNNSGQNDACKGVGPVVPCRTTSDCATAAMDPNIPAACQTKLLGNSVSCVEGTCRRGVYNFWSILPRTSDDITTTTR